VCVNPQPAALQ